MGWLQRLQRADKAGGLPLVDMPEPEKVKLLSEAAPLKFVLDKGRF